MTALPSDAVIGSSQVIDLRDRTHQRPIVIIHSSDEMYGADRMLLEFVAALPAAQSAAVEVWLPTDVTHGATPLCAELERRAISFRHMDLPVLRRRYMTAKGLMGVANRWRQVRRELRAMDPQMVVLATSAVLPAAAGPGLDVPVVLHLQEIWAGKEGRILGALASRDVDKIIAISEAARDSLPPRLQERAIVVPNGTQDPGPVVPMDNRTGDLVYVIASRWNAWKGHQVLLEAWELAGGPGQLRILGGPPALGQGVDVVGMVAAMSTRDTVTIVGEVPDPGAEMSQADVIIVPSTNPEPFGLVTIEAFARGRAAIATAAGGSQEIVTEGTGWLVPPGDSVALAQVLAGLDRPTVQAAGEQARERYETHYSTASFAAGLRSALGFGARQPQTTPRLGALALR